MVLRCLREKVQQMSQGFKLDVGQYPAVQSVQSVKPCVSCGGRNDSVVRRVTYFLCSVFFLEKKEKPCFLLHPRAYTRINRSCHASTPSTSGRFTNSTRRLLTWHKCFDSIHHWLAKSI